MRRPIALALLVALSSSGALARAAQAEDAPHLRGSGEEFLSELIGEWAHRTQAAVDLRYDYRSSEVALSDLSKGRAYFAGIQIPLSKAQLTVGKATPVLALPVSVGAVVPVYNLAVAGLRFSGPTLARIFLGEITNWNDAAIGADNPGKTLRDQSLTVVRRADGGESTYHFSAYLAATSPEFQQRRSTGGSLKWPAPLPADSGKRPLIVDVQGDNEAVAAEVKSRPGSVGYAELAFALYYRDSIKIAAVKNRAGEYVAPTLAVLTRAAASAPRNADAGDASPNLEGADGYPIAHYNWLLLSAGSRDPAKDGPLKAFSVWALATGQELAETYGFGRLPEAQIASERATVAALPGCERVTAAPERVVFKPGTSQIAVAVEFPAAGSNRLASKAYIVRGRAGQQLALTLRLPEADGNVAVAVTCPDGGTAMRRNASLTGVMTLPESGDYRIEVQRTGAQRLLDSKLDVAVTGAPATTRGSYEGTYHRGYADLEVQQLKPGTVRFHFTDAGPDGGHIAEAEGVVALRSGVGDYSNGHCHLRLRFGMPGSGSLKVEAIENAECEFGSALSAAGEYTLCGGESGETAEEAPAVERPDPKSEGSPRR